jgi:ribosomal protein S18 acetylase RimI-like enzyme
VAEIRKVDAADQELLTAALHASSKRATAADLFLKDERAHAFVAIEEDRPVGFACGYELIRPEGFWMIVLAEIGVAVEVRPEGVGRELLDAFVAFARSKGHRNMWLFTDAGDDAARRIYEGAGGDRHDGAAGYWWVFD